jgi:DNA-binding transcriptional LysR family regulator
MHVHEEHPLADAAKVHHKGLCIKSIAVTMPIDHANLSRLDLNLLVAFDTLIAERHVTRAAQRVGLGQSAMSHNLRRLRDLFGDELLTRSGSEMIPTPRAAQLADRVRALLAQLQSSVLSATIFDPRLSDRHFAIGMSPSLEISIGPKLLASINREAPNVSLSLHSEAPEVMLRALDEGQLDLAIGAFTEGEVHHKRRLLREAEGYLCLFDAERVGLRTPLSPEDFCRLPQVTVLSTDSASQLLDQSLQALGVSRRVIYRTPHVMALPFLLRETGAIAILCYRTAMICARTFGLATSPIPFPLPPQHVAAVWHTSNDREPGHKWLREKLLTAAVVLKSQEEDGGTAPHRSAQPVGRTPSPVAPLRVESLKGSHRAKPA